IPRFAEKSVSAFVLRPSRSSSWYLPLISRDYSAISGRRERRIRIASGGLLPPSPPAEKAAARKDQAGKARTGDGPGDDCGDWKWGGNLSCRRVEAIPRFP